MKCLERHIYIYYRSKTKPKGFSVNFPSRSNAFEFCDQLGSLAYRCSTIYACNIEPSVNYILCKRELHPRWSARSLTSTTSRDFCTVLVIHFSPDWFLGKAPSRVRYDASKGSFNCSEFQLEFLLLLARLLYELSHPAKDELDPRAVVCSRAEPKGGQMFAFFWGSLLPNVPLRRISTRHKVGRNFISVIVASAYRGHCTHVSMYEQTRENM